MSAAVCVDWCVDSWRLTPGHLSNCQCQQCQQQRVTVCRQLLTVTVWGLSLVSVACWCIDSFVTECSWSWLALDRVQWMISELMLVHVSLVCSLLCVCVWWLDELCVCWVMLSDAVCVWWLDELCMLGDAEWCCVCMVIRWTVCMLGDAEWCWVMLCVYGD